MKVKKAIKKVIPALITAFAMVTIAFVVLSSTGMAGYYITIGKSAHGTVTADRKRAKANEMVTLNCTADEGYELKEISVNGEPLEELSFMMPEGNILIEAKFAVASVTKGESKHINNPAPQSTVQAFKYENGESISAKPVYESETFGTAGDYPSRYAFDLSHDDGTKDAYVDSVFAGGEVPLFFKDVVSTDFYMETEVTVLNKEPYCMEPGTPKDPSPRIGLIVRDASKEGDSDTRFLYWNLTCFETYDSNQMICLTSDINGMSIDWKSWEKGQTNVRSLKCTDGNYVKLAIARLGDTFYLIANDEVVMVRDDIEGFNNSEDTASAVGFMTYSTSARFRNYSVVTDASKVKTTLESMGVTLK